MIATWLHKARTNTRPPSPRIVIALAAIVLLLIVESLIVSDVNRTRDHALEVLESTARQETEAKSRELSQVLADLYVTTRTIAMLPAVRRPAAQNRASDKDDVIDGRRFTTSDAQTVTQLYLHLADLMSVSEIYIVYDGFKPHRGEVPFLMFDSVIVDRFRHLSQTARESTHGHLLGEAPEQVEEEEYAQIVHQLNQFRRDHPTLPAQAPHGMPSLISEPIITCDNSQFLSTSGSQQRDRTGMMLSVPIYDEETGAFKGLVTTVVRLNVLEARLLGWPNIPVTPEERSLARGAGLDKTPAADYALTHEASSVAVTDRRNAGLQDILAGNTKAGLTIRDPLEGPMSSSWVLSRHVPQASFDAIHATARHDLIVGSLIAIGTLTTLAVIALIFISQRRNAALLKEQADYDALTGLPNRRQLDRTLDAGLRSATMARSPLMVVMVDLDNFKTVNDVHGHHVGDLLLIEVARRFQKQLRSTDVILGTGDPGRGGMAPSFGRLGGDEFLIVLPGVSGEAAAHSVAERLLSSLAVPMLLDGRTIQARASMGVAVYPDHGETVAQLMRCADQAMYQAKRVDDSAVILFQREVDPQAMRRIRLTRDLREALLQEQFELHYQPVVNLTQERVDSVEALLRWRHPEFGLVSPGEFVPLLESSGVIVPVGLWALRKACKQLMAWRSSGLTIESIAVNVSFVQLSHSNFSNDAMAVIAGTGIDPSRVTVEVTESVLMENPERSITQLCELRDAGVRISIDDFGTGYSSLSYLQRLPVHSMKIDRSLLVDAVSPAGRTILSTMVRLSIELGLDCVVEGVETLEQYQMLREIGCRRLQGYLFSRPLPADEAEAAASRINQQQFNVAGADDCAEADVAHHRHGTAPAAVWVN